jgi:teichuronic acid biosynthesis glycosyltransferase TuaC
VKILTFSSLYPNERQPGHGIFVENRLRHLLAYAPALEAQVVAPVPWFPFGHAVFGSYAVYAGVPAREKRHGIVVWHPRFPVIPKLGMRLAPALMYRFARACVRRLLAAGFDFDLIDAHYFYPDGVAAMWLADEYRRPLVVTGRGTDLNLIARYPKPRRLIQETITHAAHLVTVSGALRERLHELGARPERVTVLRNGVDLTWFLPADDRDGLRRALGLGANKVLVSVGNLVELKGHHLVIEALRDLAGMQLVVIGDGEMAPALRRLAERLGMDSRVVFTGRLGQDALRQYYQAADALVLASSREGWANVLLESMACGTPVVATPVGGSPEVVAAPAAGRLTEARDAAAIVRAVRALFDDLPDRAATRAYAEQFSWDPTSRGQLEVFERAMAGYRRG